MTNIIDSLHEDHANLANLTQREDPLFGAGGEARFATLRRDILHSDQDAP